MNSVNDIKKEISKFFDTNIIPNDHPRVETRYNYGRIVVIVKEIEENTSCKSIRIEFPDNAEILPFRVDKQDFYKIFKYKKNCEAALLVLDDGSRYLILAELKSTIRVSRLVEIKEKLRSSLYLVLTILRYIGVEPDDFCGIIGYDRFEGFDKRTTSPTEFDMYEMDRRLRSVLKEWTDNIFVFEGSQGSDIRVRMFKIPCNSLIWWEDLKLS